MDWERQGVGPNAAGATAKDKGIPQIRVEKIDKAETNSGHLGLPQSKSDSDLGGSGGSMPNITFALNDAACCPTDVLPEEENGLGRSGSKLNVYCSPRMSRRSFQDGDTNAGEQGCWLDGFEPSKSLLSLRSSVQLGSTTSLDTNFTGRSLGLLSDDSERTFLSDKPPTNSPTRKLLRRFFSDPENCPEGDTNINRSSQSWTNLKDAQMSFIDIDGVDERLVGDVVPTGEVDLDAVLDSLNHQEDSACQNLVSSRHTQKALSEGRIRQWLHDMNRDQQQQQPANDIPE